MKKKNKIKIRKIPNLGFIPDKIAEDHYVLGGGVSLGGQIIQPNGQWDKELPVLEIQRKNYLETYNCTAFGTTNALEILHKKKFGEDTNNSDRFLGIAAGTFPPGNSPHAIAQAVRHSGLISEDMLPFTDNLITPEMYFSFLGANQQDCEAEGKNWLTRFSFGHEWVLQGGENQKDRENRLKTALQYSPVGIAVFAWAEQNGLYISQGSPNHWVCLFGYEESEYWLIFDSYDAGIKKLALDFTFGQAKRFSLEKIMKESWWRRLLR